MAVLGAVIAAFGVYAQLTLTEVEHNMNMLFGMFTGFGVALLVSSGWRLIRRRLASPEALQREEIEHSDERNRMIAMLAASVSYAVSQGFLAVMAFLFVAIGYPLPGLIAAGALCLSALTLLLATRHYRRKL
ncbi:MAG: hypothetical protein LBK75_05725 [Oscillospiraceae bacterium]|jgi:hypothetical protein|nr:hypothetical protein [Oscillospiraceae bacterium]